MFERIFTTSAQGWLDAHPSIAWVIGHPFWALGILLLIVFLFWGLLKAIVRFIETAWIVLLKFPFKLGQWIFKLSVQAFKRKDNTTAQPTVLEPSLSETTLLELKSADSHQRLAEILTRLESLKQEQDELLQELKAILSQEELDVAVNKQIEPNIS